MIRAAVGPKWPLCDLRLRHCFATLAALLTNSVKDAAAMSHDWLLLLRELSDALERSEAASDPRHRPLIVRARTLAYLEEAARWRGFANDASSPSQPTSPPTDGSPPAV